MTLKYECSDGTIINLMKFPIMAQSPETLATSGWKYETISGINGIGKIKQFYKETNSTSLKLSVMADSKEEFNEISYRLHRCFERDVRSATPGKLWWNDFYKYVFCVEKEADEFEEDYCATDIALTFISVNPYWIKQILTRLRVEQEETGLDFPYDYGSDGAASFDFYGAFNTKILKNNCIYDANFKIVFYGPCENCAIQVADHIYEVETALALGEQLIIDSVNKKVYSVDQWSNTTNKFNLRNRDSYIFHKIPSGNSRIEHDSMTNCDIILYDERGEPDWI